MTDEERKNTIEYISTLKEQELLKAIESLRAELETLKKADAASVSTSEEKESKVTEKKNHLPLKPQAGRKYQLLSTSLAKWGKVPRQEADIASILANNFDLDAQPTEAEVFATVTANAAAYPSLAKSVQHPTWLFAYYRGLDKRDGKHAGFIKRNFLRVIE